MQQDRDGYFSNRTLKRVQDGLTKISNGLVWLAILVPLVGILGVIRHGPTYGLGITFVGFGLVFMVLVWIAMVCLLIDHVRTDIH